MNAEAQIEPDYRSSKPGEALYFKSGDHRLFGWLHQSDQKAQPRLGLVVCKPFGHEAIYSHGGLRAFADAAAAIGVPAMRFDYSGTGDSADLDPEADQLDAWSDDIVAAVEELQRRTGVERVCLLGFRLGGLLAVQVARRCKVVSALVVVSPIIRGKKYLRELRTTSLASISGVTEVDPANSGTNGAASASDGDLEVAGFSLSAASIAALSQADLTATQVPPLPDMLIIDGNSLPTARRWAEALCGNEARTKYLSLPGLIEMIMTPPHLGSIPQEMIGAARDWLVRYLASLPRLPEPGAGVRLRETATSTSVLLIPNPDPSRRAPVTERPVFFGSEGILFGIVTEPCPGEKRRGAVILLNAGGSYHVGASRMYVPLARRWASRGYVVLRMDYAGLGDSSVRPGQRWGNIFPSGAIADIRAGIELLENHYGVRDVSLAGLCSGAYHALHAAVAALPVTRILMVNPVYYWHDENSLDDVQRGELVRDTGAYQSRTFSLATWKRLLTGQIHVRFVVRSYSQRLLALFGSAIRDFARRVRIRLPRDLGWELEKVAARGVRLVFVFAPGEPGLDLLNLQAGASIRRLGERCRVHIVESGDHVFSKSGPREAMVDILSDELDAPRQFIGADSI